MADEWVALVAKNDVLLQPAFALQRKIRENVMGPCGVAGQCARTATMTPILSLIVARVSLPECQ